MRHPAERERIERAGGWIHNRRLHGVLAVRGACALPHVWAFLSAGAVSAPCAPTLRNGAGPASGARARPGCS